MAYLTFTDYVGNGGKCSESAFDILQPDAEVLINYCTNHRLEDLTTFPDNLGLLETRVIDYLDSVDINRDESISSYSDGIESFSYNSSSNSVKNNTSKVFELCKIYLRPEYIYRGGIYVE